MASKKENLKSLFSNTRTRVIIIFTAALLIIAVVIGFLKIRSATTGSIAAAEVSTVPGGIQSIPGVLDPTAQYAKLQEEQNVTQAEIAEKQVGVQFQRSSVLKHWEKELVLLAPKVE